MKNIGKISIIIMLLVLAGLLFSNYSQASEISDIFSDADDFLDKGDPVGNAINETQLKETSDFMYKLLMAIGIIVLFIVGTVIGIQYMVASAEDKAKVKEALIPYIVGCIVIFGAFTIWSTVVRIGQDVVDGGGDGAGVDVKTRVSCLYCGESKKNPSIPCNNKDCEKYGWQLMGGKVVAECLNCNHEFDWDNNTSRCPNCKLTINRVIWPEEYSF